MRRLIPLLVVVALLAPAPAGLAQSSDSSALINEALDKQYQLELTNTPLGPVMERITADTGVPIRIDPEVFELLPWGNQSSLKVVKIEGQTLREALTAMTRKFGLTWVLRDQDIEIRPAPALRRLGRRSTLDELGVLDLLASTPAALDTDRPSVADLLSAVDEKLESAKSSFAVENRAFDRDAAAAQQVPVARNATLAEALEAIPESTPATWYPWGKTILVVRKEDQLRTQLQKPISVRYNGEDLSQVLLELSERSGVPFQVEPGAVQRVDPRFRTVNLILDTTVQQALESIAGVTGLGYVVNDNGVYLWNQNPNPGGAAGAAAPRDPAVGLLMLDNGMEVIIPTSQVPDDVRQFLRAKAAKKLDEIRQQMEEEGFKPTTAPATEPANQDL